MSNTIKLICECKNIKTKHLLNYKNLSICQVMVDAGGTGPLSKHPPQIS